MVKNKVRQAIELLYTGKCTIYEKRAVVDPKTKITRYEEVAVVEEEPCRLSHDSVKQAGDGVYADITQVIKLFLAPEISIKPGSKVVVTQNKVTAEYSRSGEPAIYSNHQEVVLDLYKEKA